MKAFHVIGRKDNGKTALVVDLIEELTSRGLKIGSIKHTPHTHELDSPGKDSHKHRLAGANPAAIIAKDLTALFFSTDHEHDYYESLLDLFSDCDFVIIEGDIEAPRTKVEVWRQSCGTDPIALTRDDISAIVTDDPIAINIPVWPRSNIKKIGDKILELTR